MAQKGRRPKKYSQSDRLARMMRVLAGRQGTVDELAKEFGITRRQVYRDLQQIEEAGHPLMYNEDIGERMWQLPLGYKGLTPITLSSYELMALYFAKGHLGYLHGTPFMEDLESVIQKVEAGLLDKTINHLGRILQTFVPIQRPFRPYAAQRDVLTAIRKALLLQLTIVLHYDKPDTEPHDYPVNPYMLTMHQYSLYLLAHSHGANDLRTFAVSRMQRRRCLALLCLSQPWSSNLRCQEALDPSIPHSVDVLPLVFQFPVQHCDLFCHMLVIASLA